MYKYDDSAYEYCRSNGMLLSDRGIVYTIATELYVLQSLFRSELPQFQSLNSTHSIGGCKTKRYFRYVANLTTGTPSADVFPVS
jgi:hypothetical protein